MIINCTWAQYNYDIFKLDHQQQQQQQSCSPLKFLRLKTYICSLQFICYKYQGVLGTISTCLNYVYTLIFLGDQIRLCKHLFHVFTFSIQEPDHLGGLLLARRMKSPACSHAGTTCAFVYTDLLYFISWFPISLKYQILFITGLTWTLHKKL